MSEENKPQKYILIPAPDSEPPREAPRRGRPPGKHNDDDYVQAGAYIRRDTHADAQIELIRRRRRRQPVTEFSELVELDFVHFYRSHMAVSVSSLFSAARLFKRRVFNVMFKNSGFENKGLAKPGLSVFKKWTKSSRIAGFQMACR